MKLTEGQRKYILRFKGKKKPERIARQLGISLDDVKSVIEQGKAGSDIKIRRDSVRKADQSDIHLAVLYILMTALIAAPWILVYSFGDVSMVPKSLFLQAMTLLAALCYLAGGWRSGVLSIKTSNLTWPVVVFLGWTLLSLTWARDWHRGFVVWMHWIMVGGVFLLLQQVLHPGKKDFLKGNIHRLLRSVFISGVAIALFGICQYVFSWEVIFQTARPAATFGNKNMAAQFISMTVPAGYYLWLSADKKKWRWTWGMLVCIPLIFLFYTFTRAVWLASGFQILVLIGLLVWIRPKREEGKNPGSYLEYGKILGVMVLTVLIFMHIGPEGFKSPYSRVGRAIERAIVNRAELQDGPAVETLPDEEPFGAKAEGNEKEQKDKIGKRKKGGGSAVNRLIWWNNTLDLIRMKPVLGVGLDNFEIYYPLSTVENKKDKQSKIFVVVDNPHNEYLHLTSELGLPFVIIFVFAAGLVVVMAIRIFRSERVGFEGALACILSLSAMGGLAVNSAFSFPLYRAMPTLLLAVYAAVIVTIYQYSGSGAKFRYFSWSLNKTATRTVIVAGLCIVSFFWLGWAKHQISSNLRYRLQKEAVKQRDNGEIILWGHRTLEVDPWNYRAHHYLGRIYFEEKNYDLALNHLLKSAEAYPYSADNLFFLARAYEKKKQYSEALATTEQLIVFFPNDGRLYDLMGRIKRGLDDQEAARLAFEKAVELQPDISTYRYNLATQLHSQGNPEAAFMHLQKAVELNKENADAQKWLGLILVLNKGMPEAGVEHLKKALQLNPNIADAPKLKSLILNIENKLNSVEDQGVSEETVIVGPEPASE